LGSQAIRQPPARHRRAEQKQATDEKAEPDTGETIA
jgi:hypothetical protein